MPTVVLVEDNEVVRGALADVLALEGYDVLAARDGTEALALLREAARPCIAIVDLLMPDIDGWQLVERIRSSRLRDIPVVCMTAGWGGAPKDCAFLHKPFREVELFAAVRGAFARATG